ncbi:GumC family protein [Xanthomarina gelatinilytica]|uniref:GumC family protein n=1 Tax=Xanthomarina gelatinilytica TaxID=1137281 RepID=UPI003AA886F7
MTLVQFFRLINRNINLLLLCSLALACLVFFSTYGLPRTYEVRTEIYTGLVSGTSVESVEGYAGDWMRTSNQFDNLINVIKSDQTLGEVGVRLLASHMMLNGPKKKIIGEEAWAYYKELVTPEFRDSILVIDSQELTVKNINGFKEKHYDSYMVSKLFASDNSPYSTNGISKELKIGRIANSDLVEMTYSWTDAGICQNTLRILNDVFKQKLLTIRIGQTNDVVDYFLEKVEGARLNLVKEEDSLRDFRIRNKIINYEQQTQNIASLQNDLEQEYQKELRAQAAAQAAVSQLEKKLELNKKVVQFSNELLTKRKRLSDINSKIAELEVYYQDEARLEQLRNEASKLEAELKNSLSKRHEYSRTKEGVSNKEVLQEWLDATIALDASNAKLKILSNRESFFKNAYSEFSPLGSQLGRLERAVDVAEKKYLELNNSLNTALTKQQSESLSTGGLVVTVPPKFPIEPVKSKRLLLVLVAAIVGFMVPFVLIFLIEFLDNTLKSVENAESKTGMKLLGAFPSLNLRSEYKMVQLDWLVDKSISHLVQNIRYEEHLKGGVTKRAGEFSVLVFSIRDEEGKSFMAHSLAKEMTRLDKRVLLLSSDDRVENDEIDSYDFIQYDINKDFLIATKLEDLVPNKSEDFSIYDYVFMDFEAVLTEPYPIEVVEKFDMAICVVSSKLSWSKSDKFALEEFSSVLNTKPRLLLNGLDPDHMDSVLGEIKKTRSPLRKFIKAILTLQFNSKIASKPKR